MLDMNMDTDNPRTERNFQQALDLLAEQVEGFDSTLTYGLSDIAPAEVAQLVPVWAGLPAPYRRRLVRHLIDVSEINFELDYHGLGHFLLQDDDPGVREAAVEILWTDETPDFLARLIDLALWDTAREVRAKAASAMGAFIYEGEMGNLPVRDWEKAKDTLVDIWNNRSEDNDVRRRALESIANCTHDLVPDAIEEAYASDEDDMVISAIFAMGKSCDERWESIVLQELNNTEPSIRYEAVRASGELELEEAVSEIARAAQYEDREIQTMAVWALGEIGGGRATNILTELLAQAEAEEDDELVEAIDEALAMAQLDKAGILDTFELGDFPE